MYERLAALDAAFLYAEASGLPMHVGAVAIFEGDPFFDEAGSFRLDEVRERVAARLDLLPRLRDRVRTPPLVGGRPVWARDPDFDITRHVRLVSLPAPGSEAQLLDLVARRHAPRLDREHPLWELLFVTGLHDGRVALVERLHHAMVDGLGGVNVAAVLLDTSPTPADPVPDRVTVAPRHEPRTRDLIVGSVVEQATRPLRGLGAGARVLGNARQAVVAAARFAPRCSLNLSVGTRRRYEVVRHALEDARTTRAELGGTVNDVALAATTEGLRALLASRGELTQVPTLRAFVPVAQRQPGQALGNQVTGMIVSLPVGEADPVARYEAIVAETARLKSRGDARALASAAGVAEYAPEVAIDLVGKLGHRANRFINLVVTNVPGPPIPLYAMGARLLETFPVVPLARRLTVSVGVLSYAGQLNFGLLGDSGWMSDIHVLTEGIEAGFADLAAVARAHTGRSAFSDSA